MPIIEGTGGVNPSKNQRNSSKNQRKPKSPQLMPTPRPTPRRTQPVLTPKPAYNPIATPTGAKPNPARQPGRPVPTRKTSSGKTVYTNPNTKFKPSPPTRIDSRGRKIITNPNTKFVPNSPPSRGGNGGNGGGGGAGRGNSAPIVAGSGAAPVAAPTVAGATAAKAPAAKAPNPQEVMQAFLDQARASVSNDDLPILNQLQRDLDALTSRYGDQRGDTEQRGKRMESDLSELFGRLGNFTSQVQATHGAQNSQLRDTASNSYAALQQALGTHFDAAAGNTNAELQRLGIQHTDPGATAGITRDKAFLQGLAGVDGTNFVSNLAMQGQGFDQLMGMARNNAATEGSVRVGQAKRDTERTLAELMRDFNEGARDIGGKRTDIMSTQAQRARELAMALEDKDYARRTADQERAFAQQIAQERLGLDKAQLEASMQPQPLSYLDELRQSSEALSIKNKLAEAEVIAAEHKRLEDFLNRVNTTRPANRPKGVGGIWDRINPYARP